MLANPDLSYNPTHSYLEINSLEHCDLCFRVNIIVLLGLGIVFGLF